MGTPEPSEPSEPSSSSLAEVIGNIAKLLQNQPALLFAFGLAVILLAAGALALENLRLVLIGVLVLAIIGMIGWLLMETRRVNGGRSGQNVENRAISGENDALSGIDQVKRERFTPPSSTINHGSGSIVFGDGATIGPGNTIQTGNVGSSDEKEKDKADRDI